MDCEKFDRVVLDLLYDELDELTAAAARRHMEHCGRCGPIGAGLRATREVGVLPRIVPSPELATRILETERNARARLPLRQRFARGVSVLAGYAMRPQLAMAAVAVLMIGLSLFFVRTHPGDREAVRVTERGVPEVDHDIVLDGDRRRVATTARATAEADEPAPVRAPSPPAASGGIGADFAAASAAFQAGRFAEAQRSFERLATAGGSHATDAELMAARSARHTQGCVVAAALFDDIASRHPGTSVGNEATWQAAECRRSVGQAELARRDYLKLTEQPTYAERAESALAALSVDRARTASKAAAPRPAAAAASAPAPSSKGTLTEPAR
ncbi:MAG: hypothetical protein JW751_22590 [Polyangiaceae bacterium]|nr:hypothetical protein [Polyangiaceae bacterium]